MTTSRRGEEQRTLSTAGIRRTRSMASSEIFGKGPPESGGIREKEVSFVTDQNDWIDADDRL